MKPTKHKPLPPIAVWSWLELRDWTQSVDRKLALILDGLKELTGKGQVTPELEKAINRAWLLAKRIDLKVPDRKEQTK